jgi:glycerol kinase
VCFQTLDLLDAMRADCRDNAGAAEGRNDLSGTVLRVDGGMVASDWTMQRLADILGAPVDRPTILETTALGAAYLAGLQSGLYPEPQEFAARRALDRRFTPAMDDAIRRRKVAAWKDAVARTLSVGRLAE